MENATSVKETDPPQKCNIKDYIELGQKGMCE
jgi:hypothetical protein